MHGQTLEPARWWPAPARLFRHQIDHAEIARFLRQQPAPVGERILPRCMGTFVDRGLLAEAGEGVLHGPVGTVRNRNVHDLVFGPQLADRIGERIALHEGCAKPRKHVHITQQGLNRQP